MIIRQRIADENHAVTTVKGPDAGCMATPCPECPWRRSSPVGEFPAEAYRLSAATAYDGAYHKFACHMSGVDNPKTCAGFALHCHHNFGLRMDAIMGRVPGIQDPGDLYDSYREMAEANGVDPDDPVLECCR